MRFSFQWQRHTFKMFIKNMAALHSQPGVRRKDKEGMMFVIRYKRSLFTRRYNGCYFLEIPVCTIVNHRSENKNKLLVDHGYEYNH